jgi:hypothetical protein
MAGFGQRYWVQVVYQDNREDTWVPINGNRDHARDAAALWLVQESVDFTLVLDGKVRLEGCPKKSQILDEFNREDDARAGQCKTYQLATKRARKVRINPKGATVHEGLSRAMAYRAKGEG